MHISLYTLILEENTPLFIKVNNNYDGSENTYIGVLLELVERPAGIYGKILED